MKKLLIIILVISLFMTACQPKVEEVKNDNIVIYTSFYPLSFLVDRIGADSVNLSTVIPQGVEAHGYEPSNNILKEFHNTDLFIYNGLGLEPWAEDLINANDNKNMEVLNASDYVDVIEGEKGADPHIWLSPKNMIIIGEKIKDKLIEVDETNREIYNSNFEELKGELEKLDGEYNSRLSIKKHSEILVSHKAFSYMSREYDFEQLSVAGISSEEEPSAKNIADLIDISKEKDIKYIFLETLTNSKAVEIISKEANLEVRELNPIEGLTDEELNNKEDYISIMYKNLDALEEALVK